MESQIQLGEINVDVIQKDIKNVHLSVYPPNGRVRVSAPARMTLDNIRAYVATKLDWIKAQRDKIQSQDRITPRDYVDGESHYLWGKRYLLSVIEAESPPSVVLKSNRMELHVRPGTKTDRREEIVEAWVRSQVKDAIPEMIEKWETKLGVTVSTFHVQRMKTKWGSCSQERQAIRLNTELAKKPIECLEYIVVHEMMHLIEQTHNDRFVNLMTEHLPKWRFYRDELNRLPVRHEEWKY